MIFLCYRRADSSEAADRIREWLEDRLPPGQVFMDLYAIDVGDDWRHEVEQAIPSSQAFLVIIGPRWIDADLQDEQNASRLEIEVALKHTIPLIPVLVQYAEMPPASALPPSLQPIVRFNAILIRPGRDRPGDLARLQHALEKRGVKFRRLRDRSETERLRAVLLKRVRGQIAEGNRATLHELATIELGIHEQPGAIEPPWQRVNPDDEQQTYSVEPGVRPWDLLDDRGSMLILGEPGAGKTTMLLEIGERLVERVRLDETGQLPIPLSLNLATWALGRQPLREWLIERLRQDFAFGADESRAIVAGRLVLLLDGLDEVAEGARSACIRAINEYQDSTRERTPMVVCCRADEYFAQEARLQLDCAIRVQPIRPEEIHTFLRQGSGKLAGLEQAIQQDQALGELARSPLWLNLMAVVYLGTAAEDIPAGIAADALRRQLFARYVAMRLNPHYRARPQSERSRDGRQAQHVYAPEDATRWLTWLGRLLADHDLSRFYLELLQPEMAKRPALVRILYLLIFGPGVGLVFGLVVGLLCGVVFGLVYGADAGLFAGLVVGLIFGSALGLYTGIIFGLVAAPGRIKLKDRWHFTASNLATGLFGGVLGGVAVGLIGGFRVALVGGLLAGIIFGLTFSLVDSLRGSSIAEADYIQPYMGMRRTGQNGLFLGLLFGTLFGLGGGLVVGLDAGLGKGPLIGILVGLLCATVAGTLAALFAGLAEYLKYWVLRLLLTRQGAIPSRYLDFLRFAADRTILRQVGNGFEFIHPLLRGYFASLAQSGRD